MERAHCGDEKSNGGEYSELHCVGVRGRRWCLGESEVGRKRGRGGYLYETGERSHRFLPSDNAWDDARIKIITGLTWERGFVPTPTSSTGAIRWARLAAAEAMQIPFWQGYTCLRLSPLRRAFSGPRVGEVTMSDDEIERSRGGRDRSSGHIQTFPHSKPPPPPPATHLAHIVWVEKPALPLEIVLPPPVSLSHSTGTLNIWIQTVPPTPVHRSNSESQAPRTNIPKGITHSSLQFTQKSPTVRLQ